jgi:hypothetical protein
MKLSSAAAYALAALLALTAQAPSGAPPVVVNWCAFSPWTLAPVGAGGQLPLRFTVTGNTPVDDIRFRLLWADGSFSPVDDAGTFAPGSEVHHTLSFDHYGNVGEEMLRWLDLRIESVHLTNGTTWVAPLSGGPAVRCEKYFGR